MVALLQVVPLEFHPPSPLSQVVDSKRPGLKGLQASVVASGAVSALFPLARKVLGRVWGGWGD